MGNDLGLIHIYCGDGKGKTSAAVGLAIRAAGFGYRVLFVQFVKSGKSSELNIMRGIDKINVFDGYSVEKFTFNMSDEEKRECLNGQNKLLKETERMSKEYDVVILDEIFGAISSGTLDRGLVLEFIKNKPQNLELVITGREPEKEFVDLADYVTELKKVKHPYDRGIGARMGIEK